MHLHLAALAPFIVEQSPLGCLEGGAHGDADIRIGKALAGVMRLVAHDDILARHPHLDVDLVAVAGLMAAVQLLDRDATADEMVVKPVQLGDPLADLGFQCRHGRHVVKHDLDR